MAQYLCIWVGAYWFSATSFSKWPPGGHIRFFGFWTLQLTRFPGCKSSLLWNFNFKLHMHVDGGHRQKPIDFQWGQIQNGRLVAIFDFFGFQTLTLVWLWISTPNLRGTILMYMCRSLLIFSNVNFKMAARQPYWNLGFRTLTLVWIWISTANLSGTILIYMGRSLLIFSDVTFKMAAWRPYWIFLFPE